MDYQTIIYEKKKAVVFITLNRPEALNAMTRKTFIEIGQALEDAEQDEDIRVVVIKGNGRAFCAGVDLKFSMEELTNLQEQEAFFRLGNKIILEKKKALFAAFAISFSFDFLKKLKKIGIRPSPSIIIKSVTVDLMIS